MPLAQALAVLTASAGEGLIPSLLSASILVPAQWTHRVRTPHQALLRAVLEQALYDVERLPARFISPQARAHGENLRDWFTDDDHARWVWSLGTICDHLGLDITRVRQLVVPLFPPTGTDAASPLRVSKRAPQPPLTYTIYPSRHRWHTRLAWYPKGRHFTTVDRLRARAKTIQELHEHGLRGEIAGYEDGVRHTLFVPEVL